MELARKPTKEAIKVNFAQGSYQATKVVTGLSFLVGDTKFQEDFTVCKLSGLDFMLGNTFLNLYEVEIRRRPKFGVVMVGAHRKPKALNCIHEPTLDGLGINLVSEGQLGDEVFCLLAQSVVFIKDEIAQDVSHLHKSV